MNLFVSATAPMLQTLERDCLDEVTNGRRYLGHFVDCGATSVASMVSTDLSVVRFELSPGSTEAEGRAALAAEIERISEGTPANAVISTIDDIGS